MKISKTDTIWKEWEQTCEELKRYKKTLERIGLTTDKKTVVPSGLQQKDKSSTKGSSKPII